MVRRPRRCQARILATSWGRAAGSSSRSRTTGGNRSHASTAPKRFAEPGTQRKGGSRIDRAELRERSSGSSASARSPNQRRNPAASMGNSSRSMLKDCASSRVSTTERSRSVSVSRPTKRRSTSHRLSIKVASTQACASGSVAS